MKRKNIFKFIFCILLFIFGGSIIMSLLQGIGLDTKSLDVKDYNYLECLIYLIFSIIIYSLYKNYFNTDYKEVKNGFKKYGEIILKYFAIFLAVKIASAMVTGIVGQIIGINVGDSENQEAIISLTKVDPIMMIITATFFGPIVEEGVFRLSLRKVVNNKYLFIIISGLLFGFIHIFPTDLSLDVALTHSIVYVTTGVYFAYVYEETDNIWIPIAVHSLNNLLSLVAIIVL